MNAGIGISTIALLISLLSALYSRRSVLEAKSANHISTHGHKAEILENFKRFQAALCIDGEAFDKANLLPMLISADKARLYLKPALANKLGLYAGTAYELLIARDAANRFNSVNIEVPKQKWNEIFGLVDRCRELESNLLAELESETQIVER
ncbi:hypothetical protein [Rhodanobacter sp. MP1X3]|uniref:hypothetical protein n=1 Tax=Rhodanobacter sp. MP1X3 TaxID=2723086 RepID=UPI00161EF59A|nr:hypothetical protein [Rhodanobacter sp. MP1X3]MBB6242789.1 hypothetical protein [Rhodanobacter sp. MP1X3]